MGNAGGTDSSSGEEDGDAAWKAAIESVVAVHASSTNGLKRSHATTGDVGLSGEGYANQDDGKKTNGPGIKLYQIKAQKLLDDLLEKNIEVVINHIPLNNYNHIDGGVIRLFKKAPPGMIIDPIDQHRGIQKKPRIIPGEEIDEKSKKFRHRIKSVAVTGAYIVAAAQQACQRSLARIEARDIAAKSAAKLEKERVTELKRKRGEKWLPSVAKEMKIAQKPME